MSDVFEDDAALREAFLFHVKAVVDAEAATLGCVAAPEAVAAIADVAMGVASVVASDSLDFSRHAKRKAVAPEDVLLCARHNPSLREKVAAAIDAKQQK